MPLPPTNETSANDVGSEPLARHLGSRRVLSDGAAVSGDAHSGSLRSSGDSSTGAATPGPEVHRKALRAGNDTRIRLVFQSCGSAVERALEGRHDIVARANAINDLRDALAVLWQYRLRREEQFGEIVNALQLLLLDVAAEDLPIQQIEAIGIVISRAAKLSRITDIEAREFDRILVKAGSNVSRGLE